MPTSAAVSPRATLTFEYLCRVLEKRGLLTAEQRRDAMGKAEVAHARLLRLRTGGTRKKGASGADGVHPAETLASMGLGQAGDARFPLAERPIMQAFAAHVGLPYVDLDPLKIDAKLAPQLLSRPFARRHGALIIAADDRTVTVAVADPLDHALVEDAADPRAPRAAPGRRRTPSDIQRLITDFYGFRGAVDAAEQQVTTGVDIGNLERFVKLKRVEEIEASDSHVVAAVEYILHYALDQRASDVHIEPRRDNSVVRMRIDGVLHNVHHAPEGGAPGHRLAHQDARPPRHRREAPAAGRAHQDRARRPRGRDARVDHGRRVRREARHPRLRSERAAAGAARARDVRRTSSPRPRSSSRARTGSSW